MPTPPRKTPTQEYIQGPVGQQGPQSQFIAKLPQDFKITLNYKTPYDENKPLKKLNMTPPDTKTQNHFVEKRERTPLPAEICWGADNSGAKVRKN